MRRSFSLVLVLTFATFLSACATISYRPALSLGASPIKIPAKIRMETFVDHLVLHPNHLKLRTGLNEVEVAIFMK